MGGLNNSTRYYVVRKRCKENTELYSNLAWLISIVLTSDHCSHGSDHVGPENIPASRIAFYHTIQKYPSVLCQTFWEYNQINNERSGVIKVTDYLASMLLTTRR